MTKSASQILQEARALVEQGWCQGANYHAVHGRPAHCLVGAVVAAASGTFTTTNPIRNLLRRHLPAGFVNLVDYNDAPSTTRADILALIDIALEEVTK